MAADTSSFYRIIDFKRNKFGIPGKVATVEYDPNRSARIALVNYADGEKRYILAPLGLKVGDTIMSGEQAEDPRGQHPAASPHPARHADPQYRDAHRARAASWSAAQAAAAQLWPATTSMPRCASPRARCACVHVNCMATIGQMGNVDHENVRIGKAGRNALAGQSARQCAVRP